MTEHPLEPTAEQPQEIPADQVEDGEPLDDEVPDDEDQDLDEPAEPEE